MAGTPGPVASSPPSYSEVGVGNRDLFLGYRNPVLVYCEDEGWEEFYLRLANRIVDGVHIEDVFCLGGKDPLKTRLREKAPEGKRRLFLFDKDFHDLLGSVEVGPEVVYLPRYSIENFFVDESLFVEFVLDMKRRVRRADVVSCLEFNRRLERFLDWYPNLCRHFVVALKFRLGIAGPKLSVWDFTEADGSVKQAWLDDYQRVFLEKVRMQQGWLLEDGRLENELANAFLPIAGLEEVADRSDLCHLPGKHLVEFFIDVLATAYELGDGETSTRYSYLMISIPRLSNALLEPLRARCEAALS